MRLALEARQTYLLHVTRRHFLKSCSVGLGAIVFASLATSSAFARAPDPLGPEAPHFTLTAKRVKFLHTAGGPSPLELFDYNPDLVRIDGKRCPDSLLGGKRFALIRGVPKKLGPQATFQQRGESGASVSNHIPHLAGIEDRVASLKAMPTKEFSHAPAQLFVQTDSARVGRPSLGSWPTYGLGTGNENLPAFVVLHSGCVAPEPGASIYGSGFLPTVYQGVQCRSQGDPVLILENPGRMSSDLRERSIDATDRINTRHYDQVEDPRNSHAHL